MDMGYPGDQVLACLHAASNDFDRALEYLVGGIPPPLQSSAPSIVDAREGDSRSETVRNLMDMGYPEDQVLVCLHAASNDFDRALEYLMNRAPLPPAETRGLEADAQVRPP